MTRQLNGTYTLDKRAYRTSGLQALLPMTRHLDAIMSPNCTTGGESLSKCEETA
jgi:hypothetical protein